MRRDPQPSPELSSILGGSWQLRALGASGFCDTWEGRQGQKKLFLKTAPAAGGAMLRAEADGLRALASAGAIRVPSVAALADRPEGGVLLALEWLDFAPPDADFGKRLAVALAALHGQRVHAVAGFGWTRHNFIGATPQVNAVHSDWAAFFGEERLAAMLQRLRPSPELVRAVEAVIAALPALFAAGDLPRRSLIHGDLWSGNWGMLEDGTPVVYDPAVSCSDAEAELAMMELFGAPPAGFAEAYAAASGRQRDRRRTWVYQLYHVLNHAVLFGGTYAQQALQLARAIVG